MLSRIQTCKNYNCCESWFRKQKVDDAVIIYTKEVDIFPFVFNRCAIFYF